MSAAQEKALAQKLGLREQLRLLFASKLFNRANFMEMLERLAYYGLRTVVPLYMVLSVEQGGPEFDHLQKGGVFAWWALVQSLVPVFSGGFADRYGLKRTVAIAIAIKTAGYLVMAWCLELGAMLSGGASSGVAGHPAVYASFMAGALLLALGTAVFKPGLQGMLALSMAPGTKSTGWAVFYQLVNVGGFLGPFLAGAMRLLEWRYVFISCAIVVCLNYLVLLAITEPKKTGEGFGEASAGSILWQSIIGVFQPRLFCFIAFFSGFWLMFNQLFDLLPNFIADWIDSSGPANVVARPIIEVFGGTMPVQWHGNLPQEYMINLNAGLCMTLAFIAGYVTGRMRAITAMAIGIGVSCVAIWALGFSQNGWLTLAAIGLFSIGEIIASPRKAEYLSSLAPKGREALYLGYVNATQAIGWSLGSILAGRLYQEGGDKVVLARRMLVERFAQDGAAVEAMAKDSVMPRLTELLGVDLRGATQVLWDAYQPGKIWGIFAIIGVSSMLGLFLYGYLVKKLTAEQDWIFGLLAIVYTWTIHDQHSFTSFPKYAFGFAVGMGIYVGIRHFKPEWIPEGAGESG